MDWISVEGARVNTEETPVLLCQALVSFSGCAGSEEVSSANVATQQGMRSWVLPPLVEYHPTLGRFLRSPNTSPAGQRERNRLKCSLAGSYNVTLPSLERSNELLLAAPCLPAPPANQVDGELRGGRSKFLHSPRKA